MGKRGTVPKLTKPFPCVGVQTTGPQTPTVPLTAGDNSQVSQSLTFPRDMQVVSTLQYSLHQDLNHPKASVQGV